MVALLPRWKRGEGAWTAILLAAAAAGVGLVSSRLFGTPSLVSVFAVPLGVTVGPVAVWGLAVGWLLRDLATGIVGPSSLVYALADGTLVLLGAVLWRGRTFPDSPVSRSALATVGVLVGVAFTAAVGSACLLLWGLALVGDASPAALGPVVFVRRVVPATVLVLPAVAALSALPWPATIERREPVDGVAADSPVPVRVVAALGTVFATWFGGMLIHDVLRRDVAAIQGTRAQLLAMVPDVLHAPVAVAVGPHAEAVRLLGGAAACALVCGLLYPELSRKPRQPDPVPSSDDRPSEEVR